MSTPTHINEAVSDAVEKHMRAVAEAIEETCRRALMLGVGVIVIRYADGTVTVNTSDAVPFGEIYES